MPLPIMSTVSTAVCNARGRGTRLRTAAVAMPANPALAGSTICAYALLSGYAGSRRLKGETFMLKMLWYRPANPAQPG